MSGSAAERSTLSRVLLVGLGVVCIVVGAALTVRPFSSLAALVLFVGVAMLASGVTDLVAARRTGDRVGTVLGAAWVLGGVLVLAWPGLTIKAVAVVAGLSMLLDGAVRAWQGLRGERNERITAVISGAAAIIFGILALSWPDVTVLVIAVFFGARTVLFGVGIVLRAVRGSDHVSRGTRSGWVWRLGRGVRAAAALLLALVLVAVSAAIHRGHPSVTAFYSAPSSVPSTPGKLLRWEPFTRGMPAGTNAWRILYTTTRSDGSAAVASGLVMVSKTAPAGPRPVIAWAHGTTGFAQGCAPTLLKDPLGSGAMPDVDQVVSKGWVLVATDYIGLGTKGPHPYLIGDDEARSVLDAVRAARQLSTVHVSDQTVVWGHSQGGGAALWTGQVQPKYAPDVPLAGVAAMAPASDLKALAGNLDNVPGGSLFASFIISAYSAYYSDVKFNSYVRPGAQSIMRAAASRCLAEPGTLLSIVTSLALDKSVFSKPLNSGPLATRLGEDTATGPIPAPLFIAQGGADALVLPPVQKAYAKKLCDTGQALDYKLYPGYDHVGVVSGDSPLLKDLISWTDGRLAGQPQQNACGSF